VASSSAGSDDGFAQWDRGNKRGLGHKRFVRKDTDPETGELVDVYELVDDDEWNDKIDWGFWNGLK
jgi:hypothetical protein